MLTAILLLLNSSIHAQTTATADSSDLPSLFDYRDAHVEYINANNPDYWQSVDTTLNKFYMHNPARTDVFEPVWLGNLGAPVQQRFFSYDRLIGFDYGRHERDHYITDINEVRFWRTNVPFTNVGYIAGQTAEQYFHVTHTRNIGPQVNFSIDFNKLVSEGYYQRSATDYTNTAITTWYHTKNDRYAVFLAGVRGNSTHDESGGINNDTLFDYPNPELAEPFREQAFSDWNNWQGSMTHILTLGKTLDYMAKDTTIRQFFKPMLQLNYQSTFRNHHYMFEDPAADRSYYGDLYLDPDTLRDHTQVIGSTHFLYIKNPTSYHAQNDSVVVAKWRWWTSLKFQDHIVSDPGGKQTYQNLVVGATLVTPDFFNNNLKFAISGAYDALDVGYSLYAKMYLGKHYRNTVTVRAVSFAPTIMDRHYSGFDRSWDNPVVNTEALNVEFASRQNYFEFHAMYQSFSNYYFTNNTYAFDPGEESQIVPDVEDFTLFKAWIQCELSPGVFVFENAIGIQKANEDINLPVLLVNTDWYYQDSWFKNALHTRIGVHGWICSSYTPIPYDMITGRFTNLFGGYLQTPFLETFDPEPILDIYASFDIRTLRFFLKLDNVTEGLFSKGYYQAPNYPAQPRAFKLGIDWNLYY